MALHLTSQLVWRKDDTKGMEGDPGDGTSDYTAIGITDGTEKGAEE